MPAPRPASAGVRWVGAGLLDQVVIATANAGMTLLPLGLWGRSAKASNTVLTIGLGYLVLGISREFVGNVLLAQAPRLEGADRDRLARHGQAAAFSVGCLAAVVLVAVGLLWRHPTSKIDLSYLSYLAPFLPFVLLHDSGRYTYLSVRAPAQALVIDSVWVGTQAVLLVAMALLHLTSPGFLLASWGLGACAGLSTFLVRTRARPWRGDPRRWLVETRHLSGWFTATALVGQFQVQAVGFVVQGGLTPGDLAVLRSGQTAFLQPVQNFVTAMLGLLVPRSSRLAGGGDRAGLHRQTVRIAAGFAGLGLLLVAVVVPLAHLVLPHLQHYRFIEPLALPISIQAGLYLMQIPFTAAVRGMHRARLLFFWYCSFTTCSLTGLLIGAHQGGLSGAAWGLTVGATIGLVAMVAVYGWALARLPHPAEPTKPREGVEVA